MSLDVLARGWAPSRRTLVAVYTVVGLALVFSPFLGGAVVDAVGLSETVEYQAVEVSPDGGQLDVAAGTAALKFDGVEGIDCFLRFETPRRCALERLLVNGNVTVAGDGPSASPLDRYTYHDRLYERVQSDGEERVEMGLRPVPANEVLANVSIPVEHTSEATKRAVERGSVTVSHALPASNHVVDAGDAYYLIAPQSGGTPEEWSPGIGTALLVAIGLLALRRGRTHDERRREDDE